ncbi:hypothetical protein GF342_02240 [Candidatus Woesearchaeota archaeon]|nr:hypothetical protein [Candidatus Woesearchaeota archaeon]
MKPLLLKSSAIIVGLAVVASLVLSTIHIVPWMVFWIVAIVAAIFAYLILPRLKD